MHDILAFLAAGAALGLAAGLTPGPLQALICLQTITHGPREGAKVGMAPLFSDLPVMLACILALDALSGQPWVMGVMSLAGALVVLRFGLGALRSGPASLDVDPGTARSWRKGVATNILNPKMILFWATVGAPTTLSAWQASGAACAAFLGAFYALLLGANLAVAWLSGRFARFLSGPGYVWTMRVLGALLVLVAARLAWDGLARLGLA
ncbi:hypothetical protein NNJEOMEG_01850 [Fundidesulfovibrio magnetotacticus]|uniref:Threonine efflux protein n=1 Tax=Fundidesulfovibrio magnetotacticus TaxID=2730080 RepID=A0A6V8LMW1_9BACT|nr:LysE family translocator [Fundidesulfovibrio magnetotacticus]GFK94012.1 hypothetical protein NNJEOMEG_01850 [Fundidesulfovibrio magnetotacticus]